MSNKNKEEIDATLIADPEEKSKIKRKIDRDTKAFMKSVKVFISNKNGGEVPPEWSMSLMLLETYYRQFLQCTIELESLDSVIVESRYGATAHPLLKIQNTAAVRLEKYMSELGLSMKSGMKLNVADPQVEDSPLDAFVKNKIEKR